MVHKNLPEELVDLMVSRACGGLSAQEQASLEAMLREHPEASPESFELAAAVSALAMLQLDKRSRERLPAHTRQRLLALSDPRTNAAPAPATPARARGLDWRSAGWLVAAGLAVVWLVVRPDAPPLTPVGAPDPAKQMAALMREADDVQRVPWGPSDQPGFEQARGEVVWSDSQQRGFMRLVGLPVNVPSESQYQLWIVDPDRDEHPVDGGVFDVSTSGELIVPIDAKLAISAPAAFAITREQPGGVVVSAGPLLLVAAVSG